MAGMKPLAYALAAALASVAPAAADEYASDWARASKAEARLVAGAAGQAAVEVRLAPGAITYWRNPGDSGAPPNFDFAGSRNLARAEPSFPAPKRIVEPDGSDAFGYDDAVVFPVAVAAVDASQPVELKLKFDYAVCEKLCLPAKADLDADAAARRRESLRRGRSRRPPPRFRARAILPRSAARWRRPAPTPGACAPRPSPARRAISSSRRRKAGGLRPSPPPTPTGARASRLNCSRSPTARRCRSMSARR